MKADCCLCRKNFERGCSYVKRNMVESKGKKIFLSTITAMENDDPAEVCDHCLEELMIRAISEEIE